MDDTPRLSPSELRTMAQTSADPIIQRALKTLADDYEEEAERPVDAEDWF
ncbi:hypothetical protein [Sphingomicrobium arenosum]|nr:hypothetical protein [Sphingomicrobium arenosum]